MPVPAGLGVAAAVSTIGALGIDVGSLIKDNTKRSSIIEARLELSYTLAMLDKFQEIIQDDFMVPLVGRYRKLDVALRSLEERVRTQKGFKQAVKSFIYRSDRQVARTICSNIQHLHHDVRAASDSGRFEDILKKRNLTSEGNMIGAIPHPIPVAGYSMPLHSKGYELINSSTTTFSYPPRARVGSLASIESNPFKDPPGTTPM